MIFDPNYSKRAQVEKAANKAAGNPEIDRASLPVNKDKVVRNRIRVAENVAQTGINKIVLPPQPKKAAKMLTPVELKRSILDSKIKNPRLSYREKTWEDNKLCKDEEDGAPGIRAGMNQDERQLQYSANITPIEISDHIYDLRKQTKA